MCPRFIGMTDEVVGLNIHDNKAVHNMKRAVALENQKQLNIGTLIPSRQITPAKQDQPACEVNLISAQVNVGVWEYSTNFCKKPGHELVGWVEDGIDWSVASRGLWTHVAWSQQAWGTLRGEKKDMGLWLQSLQIKEHAQDDKGSMDSTDQRTNSPSQPEVGKERASCKNLEWCSDTHFVGNCTRMHRSTMEKGGRCRKDSNCVYMHYIFWQRNKALQVREHRTQFVLAHPLNVPFQVFSPVFILKIITIVTNLYWWRAD